MPCRDGAQKLQRQVNLLNRRPADCLLRHSFFELPLKRLEFFSDSTGHLDGYESSYLLHVLTLADFASHTGIDHLDSRHLRSRRMRVLVVLITLLIAGFSASAGSPNGIAAIVNDTVITYYEVQAYTFQAVDLLRRTYGRNPEVLNQKVTETMMDGLEQLIEKQLILDDFKAAGGLLPESIIDDEVKDRIRKVFGDRITATKSLQAQGKSFESFRKEIHDEIIVQFMRQKNVASAITISPTKIEHYYATNGHQFQVQDEVKLRMIMLNRADGSSAGELLARAREISRKVEEGIPFGEMAAAYHQGSQKGGDWGWVERKVLNKGLSEIAFSLRPGERSGVIGLAREADSYWIFEYTKTNSAAMGRRYSNKDEFLEAKRFQLSSGEEPPSPQEVYLMLVEEKRDARVRPLEEVRDEIEKTLIFQERARLHKQWIDRLKAKHFVAYF